MIMRKRILMKINKFDKYKGKITIIFQGYIVNEL